MEVSAKAKYVRRTPRKARLVADAVEGMRVADALAFLEFSPKHAAQDVAKVIKSAAANAEHNFNLDRDDLVLKQLLVDDGPTIKRIRPVSRGMAHQYFRRTCHITAVVQDGAGRPAGRQGR
jgi:large subunit ribosomal protein L22